MTRCGMAWIGAATCGCFFGAALIYLQYEWHSCFKSLLLHQGKSQALVQHNWHIESTSLPPSLMQLALRIFGSEKVVVDYLRRLGPPKVVPIYGLLMILVSLQSDNT